MMGAPNITAFYSFKGGVGRTLALTNVAHQLSAGESKVLMIDGDIEAPGLSFWPDFHEALRGADDEAEPPNFTDFLRRLLEHLMNGNARPHVEHYAKKIWPAETHHRSDVYTASMIALSMQALSDSGQLDLIACGIGDRYVESIQSLNELVAEWEAPQYNNIRNDLRTAFRRCFAGYDAVLIDTRTGLTPLTGFIIENLADNLVIVSSLNEQNVRGTEALAHNFIKHFSSPGTGVCFVASPIPASEIDLKRGRVDEFRRRILREGVSLASTQPPPIFEAHYLPRLALAEESNVVGRWPDEPLARDYRRLFKWVITCAGRGIDAAERDLNVALEKWNTLAENENELPTLRERITVLREMIAALRKAAAADPEQARALASITAHRKFVQRRVHGSKRGERLFVLRDDTSDEDASGLRFPVLNVASRLDPTDTVLTEEVRRFSLSTGEVAAFLADALPEIGYPKNEAEKLTLTSVDKHTNVNHVWNLRVGSQTLFVKHATPVVKSWRGGAPSGFENFTYPTDRLDYELATLRLFEGIRARAKATAWVTPRPLLYDRGFSLLVMSDIGKDRRLLAEILRSSLPAAGAAENLASAVSDVHRYSRGQLSVRVRSDASEAWISEFIWGFKTEGVRRVLQNKRPEILDKLRLASSHAPTVLLFVDLADKNIFVGDKDVALCDFEAVHRGDPAFDLGHVFGELLFWPTSRIRQKADVKECAAWLERFFAHYCERMDITGSVRDSLLARSFQYGGVILLHRAAGASKKGTTKEHEEAATVLGTALLMEAITDFEVLGSYGQTSTRPRKSSSRRG